MKRACLKICLVGEDITILGFVNKLKESKILLCPLFNLDDVEKMMKNEQHRNE